MHKLFHIFFVFVQTYFYYLDIILYLYKIFKLHQIMIKYNQIFFFDTIGLAALKSMMMGGMSLLLSMMMLSGKFGKGGGGGGGPWKGGGGGGGGGKIIVFTFCSTYLILKQI